MTQLIEVVDPDLSWLDRVHLPETMVGDLNVKRPFALPAGELRALDGKATFIIEHEFAVACGAGVDVAVRGRLPAAGLVLPPDVLSWAAEVFFATAGIGLVRTMTLDALARLADLPDPRLARCPRCRGKLREPGAALLTGAHASLLGSDGSLVGTPSQQACTRCGGHGRVADFTDGYEEIATPVGPIKVDRRALRDVVPHLRGDEVALCVAPSVDVPNTVDAHLRPHVLGPKGERIVGGDWRVLWHQVPADSDLAAPPTDPAT